MAVDKELESFLYKRRLALLDGALTSDNPKMLPDLLEEIGLLPCMVDFTSDLLARVKKLVRLAVLTFKSRQSMDAFLRPHMEYAPRLSDKVLNDVLKLLARQVVASRPGSNWATVELELREATGIEDVGGGGIPAKLRTKGGMPLWDEIDTASLGGVEK